MSSSYLTYTEADAIAAEFLSSQLAAYLAASSSDKGKALLQASLDVDAAGPFQGRKYDPAPSGDQVREFPRLAYDNGNVPAFTAGGDVVWDWDRDTSTAVVPYDVKVAVVFQADEILSGRSTDRLNAQHAGLLSQSADGVSESYAQPTAGGQPVSGLATLSRLAAQRLKQYRLRSGKVL